MSGMATKIGGETTPTAVGKRTGQINGGGNVIVDKVNIQETDLDLVTSVCSAVEAPPFTSEEDIDSLKSSYIINITNDEVNSYINSSTVKEKLKSLDDALVMKPGQPKIEKVPLILSQNTNFHKYYKPRMVSIGPYHHGSPNLNIMEKLKLKIVMQFIQKHRLPKEIIYSKIRKEIRVLREFYEEESVERFDDDELAWMFFLDGCTILHHIYCATENKNDEDNDYSLTFVKHDLFLLENQLPYRVLKLVISCFHTPTEMKKFRNSIEDFILDSIKAQWEKHEKLDHEPRLNEDPKHLLDLLQTKILRSVVKSPTSRSIVPLTIEYLLDIISKPLEKFKDLIEYISKALEKPTEHLQFCRNVEELKAAGIRLKPNNTGRLIDITFNLGTLRIHPIKVDDTTISMFLNLIAYEMTPDFPKNFRGISSYLAFLDSLIDRTQDVKELRDEQILRNVLGSDEEVAKLFNEISTNLVLSPTRYSHVKRDLQNRYMNTWMTGIAQLNHQYFQSPWSVIAFLAAVAILALTIIQTVYTTLGYYNERKLK